MIRKVHRLKALLHKRLQAGSLLYVISISLVIGLLLSFFILFISYKKLYREQLFIASKLLHNAESGINLLCADQNIAEFKESRADLYDHGKDSVVLKRLTWGAFNVLVSNAFFKEKHEALIACSGSGINPEKKVALYLADLDRPVSVSGNTLLKGVCYIPKAGIKSAFVEGSSFTGDKIIDGESHNSEGQVPAPDPDWLEHIVNVSKREFDSPSIEPALLTGDSMRQSFDANTLLIEEKGSMQIDNIHLNGNIILAAGKKITIGANCRLHDVLVVAPYIHIEEGFTGNAHFIATDTIIVDQKTELLYPSSLIVAVEKTALSSPYILVDESSHINGIIMAWKKEFDIRYQPKILLNKEVVVKGQVFSNGYVGLNTCTIQGSVYATKLLLVTGSAVYENHLLNTVIDGTKLPDGFSGIRFKDSDSPNTIAKWLY